MTKTSLLVAAACGLLLAATIIFPVPARAADVGSRLPVCAEVEVMKEPARLYLGLLEHGDTFRVHRYSPSEKYAHGFAYGDANKRGWILAGALCGDEQGTGRVAVCTDVEVMKEPARVYRGLLEEGQTFRVRRYSPSAKYAYGFAYGHADKHGWIPARALCER